MTLPYTSPEGFHRHQCWHCGFVWEHADDCADLPREERLAVHRCLNCNEKTGRYYTGDSPPDPQPLTFTEKEV